uniref:Globin family profile domain-containing protein n=1 Tax=Plectus sambesii TaxID=2011161 RepID=A0A914V8Z8_9BILA
MGNQPARLSRQGTLPNITTTPRHSKKSSCISSSSADSAPLPRSSLPNSYCSSQASTDSESINNNAHNNSLKQDDIFLCTGEHTDILPQMLPMKPRKVSRATSVGRMRSRRTSILLGMSPFSRSSDDTVLTDDKKSLVQQAWSAVLARHPEPAVVGLAIYQRIFTAAPELRAVFQIPEDVETDVLQEHMPFHRSGKLFISVLDLCVRNIFTLEAEMGPVLVMYGRRHFHKQGAGFRVEYLPLFSRCIVEHLTEELVNCEELSMPAGAYVQAWQLLLAYIMGKMAEGVDLEQMRVNHSRRRSIF